MSHDFMIGAHFEGRYRIDAELGAGGVGAVYRAVHLKLGRPVALKVLQERYGASSELRQRFEREAKALAALSHPNIVTVTDYGISSGMPYLVMELLEGTTLDDRLREGPLPPDEAIDIARQIVRALSFVHGQGLVHRDIKPGNIFLQNVPGSGAHIKLLDFGLAKFLASGAQDTALTRAGQVFGTPSYMAPEQVAGQETDARTDVYAVGVILFEMLTGRRPFQGNVSEVMRKHLVEPLPAISDVLPDRHATRELETLLKRATAKLQSERFQDALALGRALEALPSPAVETGAAASRPRPSESPTAVAAGPMSSRTPATRRERPSLSAGGARAALRWSTVLYAALPLAAIFGLGALIKTLQEQNDPGSADVKRPPLVAAPAPVDDVPKGEPTAPPPGAASVVVPAAVEATPERTDAPDAPRKASDEPPPPPRDASQLWRGAPKVLLGARGSVQSGTPLSRKTVQYLHEYNAKNPGDPRGHLVFARAHMNKGWRKDALNEYATAYKLNPDVRGEPKMLEDLLDLVAHGSTAAKDLVRTAYGIHARSALQRALEAAAPNRVMAERLRSLQGELGEPL